MIIVLIAVAVIAIIILIKKITASTNEYKESYDLVIKETISLLEKLQEFYKEVNDFSGLVMVIPVDCYGNLYGYGGDKMADRIRISLLFYDEMDENLLDIVNYNANKTGAGVFFRLEKMDGHTNYITISTSMFEGKYKKFMPFLHNAVAERFPKLNIKFDGSRIMIDHM